MRSALSSWKSRIMAIYPLPTRHNRDSIDNEMKNYIYLANRDYYICTLKRTTNQYEEYRYGHQKYQSTNSLMIDKQYGSLDGRPTSLCDKALLFSISSELLINTRLGDKDDNVHLRHAIKSQRKPRLFVRHNAEMTYDGSDGKYIKKKIIPPILNPINDGYQPPALWDMARCVLQPQFTHINLPDPPSVEKRIAPTQIKNIGNIAYNQKTITKCVQLKRDFRLSVHYGVGRSTT